MVRFAWLFRLYDFYEKNKFQQKYVVCDRKLAENITLCKKAIRTLVWNFSSNSHYDKFAKIAGQKQAVSV